MSKKQVKPNQKNPQVLLPAQDPNCYWYGDYLIELVYEEEGDSLEMVLLQYLSNLWEKEE